MNCSVPRFDSSGDTSGSDMLAWTHPWALGSTCNNIPSDSMATHKRLFVDEGEVVLLGTKRRRKQTFGEEQQEEARAAMEEDISLIIERDERELEENKEDNNVRCDEDVSMCRDPLPCPKIQVHVPLQQCTPLTLLDHRWRPSSPSLAIVPYMGKLSETSPREEEENEPGKDIDVMMTD